MTIVVLGSVNMDLVVRVPRLPRPGETLRGGRFSTVPGGKGANQAVACARLGATTSMIGRVGDDAFGREALAALRGAGVDANGVSVDDTGAPTGVAMICVSDAGDNTIVTSGGANHRVGESELHVLGLALRDARLLLVQLEIPRPVVEEAVALAGKAGVAVVLDPAPVSELPASLLAGLTWITPNAHETEALTGIAPADEESSRRAAGMLVARGVENVVVTLGPQGCSYAGPAGSLSVAAPAVEAVDTVAAGDAFNAGLATALAEGADVEAALRRACAAGAVAVARPGAGPSLPDREDVDALLAREAPRPPD